MLSPSGAWIIADWGDAFQRHVAGALDRPLIILLKEDGADEALDRVLVWEDADDIGATFNFAVDALQRIGRVQFGPVRGGE